MLCETELLGHPEATPDLHVLGIFFVCLVVCSVSVVFVGCFCVCFLCFGLLVACFFFVLLSVCCFLVASWARWVDIFCQFFLPFGLNLLWLGALGGLAWAIFFKENFVRD